MYDIKTSSAPINISNLFSRITSVHSYSTRISTLEHFYTKNILHLMFKVRPFHVLALKSGIGYQLVSKTHPRTLLKNPLEQN